MNDNRWAIDIAIAFASGTDRTVWMDFENNMRS